MQSLIYFTWLLKTIRGVKVLTKALQVFVFSISTFRATAWQKEHLMKVVYEKAYLSELHQSFMGVQSIAYKAIDFAKD